MRTIILWGIALLCSITTASAIEVSVGPALGVKATVNTVDPGDGLKTGFAFNNMPDLGLTTRMMFAKDMSLGLALDIEMTGYGYIMRPQDADVANDANTYVTRHSAITIAPSLYLGGLMLGVGISLPSSQTTKSIDGNSEYPLVGELASPVLEARIGAMFPVMRGKTGDLNFTIRASYMLGGHYATDVRTYNLLPNTTNPSSAGVSLGLNYLFHVVQ